MGTICRIDAIWLKFGGIPYVENADDNLGEDRHMPGVLFYVGKYLSYNNVLR